MSWADEQIRQANSTLNSHEKRLDSLELQLQCIREALDEATPENAWVKVGELKEKLTNIYYRDMLEDS